MFKLFLGNTNESKFRRIYFTTEYWNEIDENKYTLQAAERKITTQLHFDTSCLYKLKMILYFSLIECGVGCSTKDHCNTLRFKDGKCEVGKNKM